jgi:hypothetical protein
MNFSKTYLCSFASPDLLLSKIRFYFQSKKLNFYKDTKIYSKNNLSLKTILTPKKPPLKVVKSAWNKMTGKTANALSPSISLLYFIN